MGQSNSFYGIPPFEACTCSYTFFDLVIESNYMRFLPPRIGALPLKQPMRDLNRNSPHSAKAFDGWQERTLC